MAHIRRDFARNTKVPGSLAAEIARVTSKAQGQWAEARANEDVAAARNLGVARVVTADMRQLRLTHGIERGVIDGG
ncbi:MAG: hypothetical protein AAFP28_13145 [Pseudomonadota bacterium]